MNHTDGPPDTTLLERCPCGCSIYQSKHEPTLFLERCLLHDSAPALLAACKEAYEFLDDRTDTYPEPCEDVPALSVMITLKFAIDKAQAKGETEGDQ